VTVGACGVECSACELFHPAEISSTPQTYGIQNLFVWSFGLQCHWLSLFCVCVCVADSDVNWWKGVSWRGEGLFPANFVTSDLTEPAVGLYTPAALHTAPLCRVRTDPGKVWNSNVNFPGSENYGK